MFDLLVLLLLVHDIVLFDNNNNEIDNDDDDDEYGEFVIWMNRNNVSLNNCHVFKTKQKKKNIINIYFSDKSFYQLFYLLFILSFID